MTCYAAYDDQAPTYYCTRPRGHDGDHTSTDDDTGDLYQDWPRSLEERRSSQAGLATLPATRPAPIPRVRHCPRCTTGVLAYSRRGDTPWAYCTTPDCPYEFD